MKHLQKLRGTGGREGGKERDGGGINKGGVGEREELERMKEEQERERERERERNGTTMKFISKRVSMRTQKD